MDRRAFIGTLAGGLLAAPLAAEAQQVGQVARLGYLSTGSPPVPESFRQGLREFGWAEGQNIVIEPRFAEDRLDRLPELATELVRLKVDIIVALPTPGAIAAKNASVTIPIVMVLVNDPVGLGLVRSLAHPGGNATGVAWNVSYETLSKGLELLKETVPTLRRMAVLSNPSNPAQPLYLRNAKAAAGSLGLDLRLFEARGPNDLDGAFAAMGKEHVGAVLVVADAIFIVHRERLADLAAKKKLPSMHAFRINVEAGALMSYGPPFGPLYRRAASFVDRILKGAKPGDLPIEQPTTYELVINLKTAKALGLTIPPSLLARADQVIE